MYTLDCNFSIYLAVIIEVLLQCFPESVSPLDLRKSVLRAEISSPSSITLKAGKITLTRSTLLLRPFS